MEWDGIAWTKFALRIPLFLQIYQYWMILLFVPYLRAFATECIINVSRQLAKATRGYKLVAER